MSSTESSSTTATAEHTLIGYPARQECRKQQQLRLIDRTSEGATAVLEPSAADAAAAVAASGDVAHDAQNEEPARDPAAAAEPLVGRRRVNDHPSRLLRRQREKRREARESQQRFEQQWQQRQQREQLAVAAAGAAGSHGQEFGPAEAVDEAEGPEPVHFVQQNRAGTSAEAAAAAPASRSRPPRASKLAAQIAISKQSRGRPYNLHSGRS